MVEDVRGNEPSPIVKEAIEWMEERRRDVREVVGRIVDDVWKIVEERTLQSGGRQVANEEDRAVLAERLAAEYAVILDRHLSVLRGVSGRQRIDDELAEARRSMWPHFDPPSDGTVRDFICRDTDPERVEDGAKQPSS